MTDPDDATGESADEYVKEIMARDAELAERKPPERTPRSRLPLLMGLLVILAGTAGWNVVLANRALEPLPSDQELASAKALIYLMAQSILAFRETEGRLPDSLAVVGSEDDPVEYLLEGNGFRLIATVNGQAVRYADGEPLAPFRDAMVDLDRGGAR